MRLLSLSLLNFMRFKRAKLSLEKRGLVHIEGRNLDDESTQSNGAGKSSLIDALVWCLFGVTTHDPSADGDDVVNEKRLKNCEVKIYFEVGDALYTVIRRRAWKKGGKAVQLVFFGIDNKTGAENPLTKGTIKDTQDEIERVLGMSVGTFRIACVFGQGRAYRFSRLTDAEKKTVLDEMLGSEQYANAAVKAGELLAEKDRELGKAQTALESALESSRSARKAYLRAKERYQDSASRAQSERKAAKREVADLSRQLESAPDEHQYAIARLDLDNARKALDDADRSYRKAATNVDKANDLIETLKAARKRTAKTSDSKCTSCNQHISGHYVERQLAKLDKDLEEVQGMHVEASNQLGAEELARALARKTVREAEEHFESLRKGMSKTQALQERLKAAKQRAERKDDSAALREAMDEAKQRMKQLGTKIDALDVNIAAWKKQRDELQFWKHGFGAKGLRSLMLDSAMPYLNAKLDAYAHSLTGGNITVEMKTQRELKGGGMREDLHIEVKNKFGATKYAMNSIGERAKIDIIVGLALQDMAAARSRVPVNVAFFDEAFEGIDARGADGVATLLTQLQRESVFVITHQEHLKSFFNNTITVEKRDGESRLV